MSDDTAPSLIDPRHQKRIELMQALFAYNFQPQTDDPQLNEVLAELPQIDELISQAAPERPLSEINKVDLAILRTIVFESNHHSTPKKVLLNEAVELAKEFGSETSFKFVNGCLAKILTL